MKRRSPIGEFGLIQRFIKKIRKNRSVPVGPGDDCAVVRISGNRLLLLTTDMLIEGIHFRRDWMSPFEIGVKAIRVNLSDIAAMGGIPRFALISVGIPPRLVSRVAKDLFRGMKRATQENGVAIVGGDTNASDRLIINVALAGEPGDQRLLTRKGAKVGDFIYVTGHLGDSALGLLALQKGKKGSRYNRFVRRHLAPPVRVQVGRKFSRIPGVHSLIDLSDGLAGDLRHLMEESSVGAEIWLHKIPTSRGFRREAASLGADPLTLALSGGEDYELLLTASPRQKIPDKIDGIPVTKIGKILPRKSGLKFLDTAGRPVLKKVQSFVHF